MVTILLQKILDLLKENLSSMLKFFVTDPQDGQTLVYDAESDKWVNGDADIGVSETKSGNIASFSTSLTMPLVDIDTEEGATKIVHTSGSAELAAYFRGLFIGSYGFVDLADCTYTTTSWGGYKVTVDNCKPTANAGTANIRAVEYNTTSYNTLSTDKPNNGIAVASTGNVYIYSDSTPTGYLIYELASPVTPDVTSEDFTALCAAYEISGEMFTLPLDSNFNAYDGSNNVFTDDGSVTVEYYNGNAKEIWDVANHTKDLTADLTIDFQTIEESSCNVKAYQEGHIVVVEINYMKYLTTPTDTGIIITGLPKAKENTTTFVYDIYNAQVGGRMRVNTDGELTQWYFRPYPNHDICGQIVYITDEV